MANKDLKDKYFNCPDDVINKLKTILSKYKNGGDISGLKRCKDIIKNKRLSYHQMKRIKNYFDNYDGDGLDDEYKLNGGDIMKQWVNTTLENSRNTIHDMKKVQMNAGKQNAFRKHHTKDKDNADPTNVNLPKISKGSQYDNIMNNRVTYENLQSEIDGIKYLMEYMSNNKKNKIL